MKLIRRELALDLYGKEYKISFPTVRQSQAYANSLNGKEDNESIGLLADFLDSLGIPKDVVLDMESEHLTQLVQELMPAQKK